MTNQYIEREAAKRELLSWAVCMNHPEYLMRDDALHVIDSIPAADVVEVVRCKDCKYFLQYSEKYAQEVEHADGDCLIKIMHCVSGREICVLLSRRKRPTNERGLHPLWSRTVHRHRRR